MKIDLQGQVIASPAPTNQFVEADDESIPTNRFLAARTSGGYHTRC